MNGRIRLTIVLIAALIMVTLASNHVAWASFSPQPAAPVPVRQDVQSSSNEHKGTVRPPNCGGLTIKHSGRYPICGIAIIDVKFKTHQDVKLLASIGSVIPPGAGKVMAGPVVIGCLVNGVPDPGPHDKHADINICFAAHPKNKSVIKFYDEVTATWKSLLTTVKDGKACATVNYSGTYVLVNK